MEWLAANWFWVILGLGFVWLVSKGRLGCGMGGHGSHGAHETDQSKNGDPALNGRADTDAREATGTGGRRRRRGC